MLTTPVLFLVFKRPATTKQVFEAIRQSRPTKLYVAADGPRSDKDGEGLVTQEVRDIATNVDWDCEVITLFREENQGCKIAVSDAITWFFEHEEEGIILEDDCLPSQSFFPYCQELLNRYRYDTRIMTISGDNFQRGKKRTEYSYYFSCYTHVWGWASWRRAWQYYDRDLSTWPEIKENNFMNDIANGEEAFVSYWSQIFNRCFTGQVDTWDYPWLYSSLIQNGLNILPNVNLVSNIGFGEGATHTKKSNVISGTPAQEIEIPLKHPPFVFQNRNADRYTDEYHYHIRNEEKSEFNLLKNITRRLSTMIRGA